MDSAGRVVFGIDDDQSGTDVYKLYVLDIHSGEPLVKGRVMTGTELCDSYWPWSMVGDGGDRQFGFCLSASDDLMGYDQLNFSASATTPYLEALV